MITDENIILALKNATGMDFKTKRDNEEYPKYIIVYNDEYEYWFTMTNFREVLNPDLGVGGPTVDIFRYLIDYILQGLFGNNFREKII